MMKHHIGTLCAVSMFLSPCVAGFEATPVEPAANLQQRPDVDNGIIVWAEQIDGDWDVYGLDLLNPDGDLISVADYIGFNQDRPSIWNHTVVWQDDELGHWDIWLTDISDANNPTPYQITPYENDQTNPDIHGNTVVWQDEFAADDWDIYAADITEPNAAVVYLVQLAEADQYFANQQAPSIYRNRLIWQDNNLGDWDIASADLWLKNIPSDQLISVSNLSQKNPTIWGDWIVWQEDFGDGDFDIYAADISDPANPVEYSIIADTAAQTHPDISGHLVVWQDDRNGNFDIYGYNLITRQEFQITTDGADQTNPAISGSLVVWEDSRVTPANIYYTWLDGDVIANCPSRLVGDVDGDCRVNLTDFVRLAEEWLTCGLDPITACTN
jgi:beta propeller repeat protein